jgi:hypothetical protein
MDVKGSVNSEDAYLRAYETPRALPGGGGPMHYFQFFNSERRHQTVNRRTLDGAYFAGPEIKKAA